MNVAIFWHVTPYSLVAFCRLLKRFCCLPLHGIRIYAYRIIRCQFENKTILILKFNVDDETVLINGFIYISIDTSLRQIKLSLSRSRIHRGREQMYGSTQSQPRREMKLCGQRIFLATLPPQKKTLGTN
jgi:hypothetical protein